MDYVRSLVVLLLAILLNAAPATAQTSPLTVEKIMQDPDRWVGAWPSNPAWSEDGRWLYFNWNPAGLFPSDSLFKVGREGEEVRKVSPDERRNRGPLFTGWHFGENIYSEGLRNKVYERDGDIHVYSRETQINIQLTHTVERETNPRFSPSGMNVIYRSGNNLFRLDQMGRTTQLTDLRAGKEPAETEPDEQDRFLREQQEALFETLRRRKEDRELREAASKQDSEARGLPPTFYLGDKTIGQLDIDAGERFVTLLLLDRPPGRKETRVAEYVNESGYAQELSARAKVGSPEWSRDLYVQDLERDTTLRVDLHQLPGAYDVPAYQQERGVVPDTSKTRRDLEVRAIHWNGTGELLLVEVWARDNKDRWIARLDPLTAELTTLDRQRDEAWVGGPGISGFSSSRSTGWLPDNRRFFFQSERTGYSHLYVVDVTTGEITQLTDGQFEVFNPMISRDGRHWYFSSSEGSPFERHYYKMPLEGGPRTRLTSMAGMNEVRMNPDEIQLGVLNSYTNRPPEIYLEAPQGEAARVTHSPSSAWLSYDWRDPEIITIEASDGVPVPTQLFVPENPNGAAVLFVHGAGYLQNVHKGWSSYFREYMFHNLLADLGYYVMNVDYRGSAGYGRDWRTAIYRHMGGRDLQDYVDASKYLGRAHGIDPEKVFIYGGSYGGFITMMALFTEPQHFGGGAALRSVTDWAHYNHGYTANILNTPVEDSLAFARSSPIYFAEGLEDPLLIAHGMVDVNVHFQDVVRLAQRLIELGKEDWEMAVYPVEGHGFVEPASWTDEYKRILKYVRLSVGPEEEAVKEVPVLRKGEFQSAN